jgi:acyl-CoA synthetase (AMP-forming)/AMP-acid ligase II
VLECAVVGVPDETWGERVHLAVVFKPGHSVGLQQIRELCSGRISGYKSPRSMEIMDSLPKSGAGKILKREIRARHWPSRPVEPESTTVVGAVTDAR